MLLLLGRGILQEYSRDQSWSVRIDLFDQSTVYIDQSLLVLKLPENDAHLNEPRPPLVAMLRLYAPRTSDEKWSNYSIIQ